MEGSKLNAAQKELFVSWGLYQILVSCLSRLWVEAEVTKISIWAGGSQPGSVVIMGEGGPGETSLQIWAKIMTPGPDT